MDADAADVVVVVFLFGWKKYTICSEKVAQSDEMRTFKLKEIDKSCVEVKTVLAHLEHLNI